jgi:cell division protein ZapA (FtsZ GTPase activity inhibitor)
MPARSQVDKYFEALKRLKARGEPINNDAVAREAGSGNGSIKRSRSTYLGLISAIEEAAQEQKQANAAADPSPQLRQQIAILQQRLDSALERELCLLNEVYRLREENRGFKQGRLSIVSDTSP